MCVLGVYNLPGGQATLVRKFRVGQSKRIRCRDIKQHASLLQRRQSQGSLETPAPGLPNQCSQQLCEHAPCPSWE